jgi:N6-L-threonylcarbamoyladenine synthase
VAAQIPISEDSALGDAHWFAGNILALETSCDETSAAVVAKDSVLANVVSSQAKLHEQWGGIVPEAAARAHVEALLPVIRRALADAFGSDGREGLGMVDAIAVTNRPGLVGALNVGLSCAKALAAALEVPFVAIHHLEGHILSVYAQLSREHLPTPAFPHLCLIVSGGHTELVQVEAPMRYRLLGQTLDDAAGEALDKGARLLGLTPPTGRGVEIAAESGKPGRYTLPKALPRDTRQFSFSGLKTALLRLVEREGQALNPHDAAHALQTAVFGSLRDKTVAVLEEGPTMGSPPESDAPRGRSRQAQRSAARSFGSASGAGSASRFQALTLVGGVAANRTLREALRTACAQLGVPFFVPDGVLCTDNAAMIGIAASLRLKAGQRDTLDVDCWANANLP